MASIPKLVAAFSPLILLLALSSCQPITGKTAGHPNSDVSISNAVQAKLMRDPLSGFPRINVDTVRGVVTLSGMVETEAQRDRAERLTHQVAGVIKVENNIQTQNQPRHSSNAAQANERKGGVPPRY
jgi:hyperosmotically inducible protein